MRNKSSMKNFINGIRFQFYRGNCNLTFKMLNVGLGEHACTSNVCLFIKDRDIHSQTNQNVFIFQRSKANR